MSDYHAVFAKYQIRIISEKVKQDSFGDQIIKIRGHFMDVMNMRDLTPLETALEELGWRVGGEGNAFLLKRKT